MISTAVELGMRMVPFTVVHEGVLSWEAPIRKMPQARPVSGTYLPAEKAPAGAKAAIEDASEGLA